MKNNILILGGGHQGFAIAAHLASEGEKVSLWNRTPGNIAALQESKKIQCQGEINAEVDIDLVSTNLSEVMSDRIIVATTAAAHKPLARQLAPLVTKDTAILISPGRTFGAEEFLHELAKAGCKELPAVAETQTIIHTCRRTGGTGVNIYALKDEVQIACPDPTQLPKVLKAMPECLQAHLLPVESAIQTSLGNVGMILHCAPVLMNMGWIENSDFSFKYYYDGITPSIAHFLEKLDAERIAVGRAMGVELEDVGTWMERSYHVTGDTLYHKIRDNKNYRGIDAPPTIHHRYIEDDVPYGLAPLESAAMAYGIPTPNTTLVIDLACAVMECDYRAAGRKYRASYNNMAAAV